MDELDADALRSLVNQRNYRAVASELMRLEVARGVVSMRTLGDDPESAVNDSPELSLEYDPSPAAGCSVYGYYRYQLDGPSIIYVHPSYSTDRDSFTIVHEYGHHVQRQHAVWANLLYAMNSGARKKLEEDVADAFAAEVLIPAGVAESNSNWVSAAALARIHASVRASRSAVAMRATEFAPQGEQGSLVVFDRKGAVIFARALGEDVFAPARDQVQPGLAILFERASAAGGSATGPLAGGLRSKSNWIQADLHGEVAVDYTGLYAFGIVRPEQRYGRVPVWEQQEVECSNPACEHVFVVDATIAICPVCNDPRCPNCNTCSCEGAAVTICQDCWMALSVAEQNGSLVHECA